MLRKKKKKKKQTSRAKQEICYKVPNTTKKKKGKEKDIKSELRIVVAKKKRSPEHTFCKWLLVSLSAPTSPDYFANLTRGSKRRKKKNEKVQLHRNSYPETQKDKGEKKKGMLNSFFPPIPCTSIRQMHNRHPCLQRQVMTRKKKKEAQRWKNNKTRV